MNKKIIIGAIVGIFIIGAAIMIKKNQKTETSIYDRLPKPASQQTNNTKVNQKVNNSNLCDSACANYNLRCTSLVPNAGEDLFNQAMADCLKACSQWSETQAQCVLNAPDCESITDKCKI